MPRIILIVRAHTAAGVLGLVLMYQPPIQCTCGSQRTVPIQSQLVFPPARARSYFVPTRQPAYIHTRIQSGSKIQ